MLALWVLATGVPAAAQDEPLLPEQPPQDGRARNEGAPEGQAPEGQAPDAERPGMAAAPAAGPPAPPPTRPLNPRYGVFYSHRLPPAELAAAQQAFGAGAWLEPGHAPNPVPGKLPLLPLHASGRLSGTALAELVAQYPAGTAWYVGGEANVPTQGNMAGADYAPYFHEAAATIRAVDPTATVLAASVLNFVDTCRGCAGYTPGRQWVEEFRATYAALYGQEPPVDAWALDAYLLDWETLPMIDAAFVPRQVEALRAYLDAIPAHAGKPIWLTEFGVLWAYERLEWVERDGRWEIEAAGAFREDLLAEWLGATLDWLETAGVSLGVERWFLFASGKPPGEPWYHGIELLEPVAQVEQVERAEQTGQAAAAGTAARPHWRLTALGQLYAQRAAAGAAQPFGG